MSEEPKVPPPPAPSGGSKIMPILLVVNTLLIGGVVVFVAKKPAAPAAAAAAPAGEHGAPAAEGEHGKPGAGPAMPGPTVKLDNFIIQLRAVENERYLRVAFDLEVTTDADKDLVAAHLSKIRDAVISYFSDRTLDELRGSEAMVKTKQAIFKTIDEIVPGRRIKAIYLTDFIVQ
jgi:flagellar protein FliL